MSYRLFGRVACYGNVRRYAPPERNAERRNASGVNAALDSALTDGVKLTPVSAEQSR